MELNIPAKIDPRIKLAEWMTDKTNPFFARTLVNRYWKHFFGKGLVDPEDDMRITNPPTNSELLDALAKYFVQSNYDLKKLVRAITTSNVYRLSAEPNAHNAGDQQNFSRFQPRRLSAEVLLDAIDSLTESPTTFRGVPRGTRAVQLPDNQFASYFLSVFGRPDHASVCECERSFDATLAQSLHMLNSPEILKKVAQGRTRKLARDRRSQQQKIRELYLLTYSREPNTREMQVMLKYMQGRRDQEAYEDIIWALINTKEFQFNH